MYLQSNKNHVKNQAKIKPRIRRNSSEIQAGFKRESGGIQAKFKRDSSKIRAQNHIKCCKMISNAKQLNARQNNSK